MLWRDDEKELVEAHYHGNGAAWCAEVLGRSVRAVNFMAHALGVTRRQFAQDVPLQLRAESLYSVGLCDKEIAARLGLCRWTVCLWRKGRRLPKVRRSQAA